MFRTVASRELKGKSHTLELRGIVFWEGRSKDAEVLAEAVLRYGNELIKWRYCRLEVHVLTDEDKRRQAEFLARDALNLLERIAEGVRQGDTRMVAGILSFFGIYDANDIEPSSWTFWRLGKIGELARVAEAIAIFIEEEQLSQEEWQKQMSVESEFEEQCIAE